MSFRRPVETAATPRQGSESRLRTILQASTNVSGPVEFSVPSSATEVYHTIFHNEDITSKISDVHGMMDLVGDANDRLLSHMDSPHAAEVTFHAGTAIKDAMNKENRTRVLTSYALSAVTWTPKLLEETLSDRMKHAVDLLTMHTTNLDAILRAVNDVEAGFNHADVSAEVRSIWSSYRQVVISLRNNVQRLCAVLEEASGGAQNPDVWRFVRNSVVSRVFT